MCLKKLPMTTKPSESLSPIWRCHPTEAPAVNLLIDPFSLMSFKSFSIQKIKKLRVNYTGRAVNLKNNTSAPIGLNSRKKCVLGWTESFANPSQKQNFCHSFTQRFRQSSFFSALSMLKNEKIPYFRHFSKFLEKFKTVAMSFSSTDLSIVRNCGCAVQKTQYDERKEI